MCSTGDVQFSVGEQSEAIRKQFWATNYSQCPICKSENIAVNWWSCGFISRLGWGTVVYQCLGKERKEDVKNLEWDKTTRKLPGEHGCGFYTSFVYDEAGEGPENYQTAHWKKP
ncbi:unnamed protein product [Rotaria sordida]|uniref:Uncharacterized protein n=1 Tax=Rotaria sordida TaxID=392033 RepID=A0A815PVW9_9BILA|nr:unnamed protein product [Rotaria sordida]CAF1454195.1 unnamed protein product [Rotaria sordida]CAF3794811.1 unnamed protein product [Rotaria sordida]CAF3919495.1 unnamed protein product [Rotaria sordida]